MASEAVKNRILPMIRFIELEAVEKAQEIRQKAEEDFNAEKARIATEGKLKVTKEYEKKKLDFEMQKRISYCNAVNSNRLRVLSEKDEILQQIMRDVVPELVKWTLTPAYKEFMHDVIVESLLLLGEPKVVVQCREVDLGMVKTLLPRCAQSYAVVTKQACELTIAAKPLPPPPVKGEFKASCCGGVVCTNANGKISLNNTVDERLSLVASGILPQMRSILFADAENQVLKGDGAGQVRSGDAGEANLIALT